MMALMLILYPSKELICVTQNPGDIKDLQEFLSKHYLPNITVLVKSPETGAQLETIAKYTKEYEIKDNETTYYLCENHACKAPFHGLDNLEKYLCVE
jgi:uncharacterized protein YyaL (SSP411 family)